MKRPLHIDALVVANEGAVDFSTDDLAALLHAHDLDTLSSIKPLKIATIPKRSDLVVRYTPTRYYVEPNQTPERVKQHLTKYQQHLHHLGELGVGIARHTIFAESLSIENPVDNPMVYTVVECLSTAGATLQEPQGLLTSTQHHDIGI